MNDLSKLKIENLVHIQKTNMKRYNNLYNKIISKENILEAYIEARKGKSRKVEKMLFDQNPRENLNILYKELQTRYV